MTRPALKIIAIACLGGQATAQDPVDVQAPPAQAVPAAVRAAGSDPARAEPGATDPIAEIPVDVESGDGAPAPRVPATSQPAPPTLAEPAEAGSPGVDAAIEIEAGSPLARALGEQKPPPGLRTATHERLMALLEEKRYAEAEPVAKDVVTLTQREYGSNSLEVAAPLDNLATTQMLNGNLIDAEQTYLRAIDILKGYQGQLSPRLINPYVGLGATYNRGGLYEKAEEAFSTALRLNNVNEGFYNLEQMKIRDGLTETYVGMDKIEDADFQQYVQLQIHQRRLGETNPETAPAMYKLARWYERSNQQEEARYMYQRAQALIRKAYGRDSIQMASAYEGLAGNYDRQGDVPGSASYLKKALKIVEAQPEIDLPRQADLLIRLGELYGRTGRYDTANAYFERAWQALTQDDQFAELREELFAEPVRVTGLNWDNLRYAPGSVRDWSLLSEGYVLVRYDVNEKGRAVDIVIVESDPSEVMDRRVSNALGRAYFRPRMADGVAVAAQGLLYRHDFRYQPEDPGRSEEAGKPLEAPSDSGRLEYPGSSDG